MASAVEVTEMVIIVVGVGATRGWRWTLVGTGTGLTVLVGLVIGLGQALSLVPINTVRIAIGALLLVFGLQWYRQGVIGVAGKGFRRSPGEEEEAPDAAGPNDGRVDWTAFVLAFKGSLLEGLEIAFIVVAFGAGGGNGANHHATGALSLHGSYVYAYIGALAAFILVGTAGLLARTKLERVPGRSLKFGVGGLLSTFGTYWSLEGLGAHWPAGKLSLAWLYGLYLLFTFALMFATRRGLLGPSPVPPSVDLPHGPGGVAPADGRSIEAFQAEHGLAATGELGGTAQAALRAVRAERSGLVARSGSSGTSTDGPGTVGAGTDMFGASVDVTDSRSLRRFQVLHGLEPSGLLDPSTRGALRAAQHPGLIMAGSTEDVRRFQEANALEPSGRIDPATQAALQAARRVAGSARPHRRAHDKDQPDPLDPVMVLQKVDPISAPSVARFQLSLGLEPHGDIDDETRGAMLAVRALSRGLPAPDGAEQMAPHQVAAGSPPGVVDCLDAGSVRRLQARYGIAGSGSVDATTRRALAWEHEHLLGVDPAHPETVEAFQLAHGLVADGIIGPKTRAAMLAVRAERQPHGRKSLSRRYGEFAGALVRGVDPADEASIKKFQERYGLVPDGVIGQRTAAALRAAQVGQDSPVVSVPVQHQGVLSRLAGLVKGFGRFWYGFIIGDDWTVAVAALIMIFATYGLLHAGIRAFWVGPLVVMSTAAFTVRRALGRRNLV